MLLSINDLRGEIERFKRTSEDDLKMASTHGMSVPSAEIAMCNAILGLVDQLVPEEDGRVPVDAKDRTDTKPSVETSG
jgi:hypothetical protein